jgi:non-heme chloroperoxidase
MFGATWLPFVLPFATKVRFILPSLRGFGSSEFPASIKRGLSEVYADDLEDLFDHLTQKARSRGSPQAIRLGGHSLGAVTAMAYQRKYGFGRVASYLHIDQSPCLFNQPGWRHGFCGEDQDEWLAEFDRLFGGDQFDAIRHGFATMPAAWRERIQAMLARFGERGVARPPLKAVMGLARHEAVARAVLGGGRLIDSIRVLEGISKRDEDFDFRESLRGVAIPVTLFVGAKSRIYPAEGQEHIQTLISHARVVRFESAGHVLQFDSPIEFVARFAEFLRQNATGIWGKMGKPHD